MFKSSITDSCHFIFSGDWLKAKLWYRDFEALPYFEDQYQLTWILNNSNHSTTWSGDCSSMLYILPQPLHTGFAYHFGLVQVPVNKLIQGYFIDTWVFIRLAQQQCIHTDWLGNDRFYTNPSGISSLINRKLLTYFGIAAGDITP